MFARDGSNHLCQPLGNLAIIQDASTHLTPKSSWHQ